MLHDSRKKQIHFSLWLPATAVLTCLAAIKIHIRFLFFFQYESAITPGNEAIVHHIEVFECSPDVPAVPGYSGSCDDKMKPKKLNFCRHVLAAWAMGAEVWWEILTFLLLSEWHYLASVWNTNKLKFLTQMSSICKTDKPQRENNLKKTDTHINIIFKNFFFSNTYSKCLIETQSWESFWSKACTYNRR